MISRMIPYCCFSSFNIFFNFNQIHYLNKLHMVFINCNGVYTSSLVISGCVFISVSSLFSHGGFKLIPHIFQGITLCYMFLICSSNCL